MGVTNPVKHSELVWLGYWLVTFHWWLLSKSLRSPPVSGLLLVSSLERWQMEGSDQLKIILWYFHLILSWYVLWTTIFVLENNWKINFFRENSSYPPIIPKAARFAEAAVMAACDLYDLWIIPYTKCPPLMTSLWTNWWVQCTYFQCFSSKMICDIWNPTNA